jgi:hypothetical protein
MYTGHMVISPDMAGGSSLGKQERIFILTSFKDFVKWLGISISFIYHGPVL